MKLFDLKQDDGSYIDEKGGYHEDAASLIASLLGFCGCGSPEDAVQFTGKVLRLIKSNSDVNWSNIVEVESHRRKKDDIFKDSGSEYFTYYVLDEKEITEHGGSVPGWLTDKGHALLALIDEYESEYALEENNESSI